MHAGMQGTATAGRAVTATELSSGSPAWALKH